VGIGTVIGEAIGGASAGPFGAIGPVFTFLDDAIKRAFPDKSEQMRIQAQLQAALLQGDLAQLQSQVALNTAEAQHEGNFVAGWRPFIGWVCGASFAWSFVLQPFVAFWCSASGHPVALPALDTASVMPVLMGMLGIGSLRTFEKYTGSNKRR
jgi:Holin of 3TMs, for gene-transfer release